MRRKELLLRFGSRIPLDMIRNRDFIPSFPVMFGEGKEGIFYDKNKNIIKDHIVRKRQGAGCLRNVYCNEHSSR